MIINDRDGVPVPGAAPLRVAVLGTGTIGLDLVHKTHRSSRLSCELVAGRNRDSAGLRVANRMGLPTTANGIAAVLAEARPFDVVFDATNAIAHAEHWRLLEPSGALVVDLTPSRIGRMVVPTVTGMQQSPGRNVNLISCGGQAAVPIAHALAARLAVSYFEVVSTVASDIAGRATRINLDEYVATTQHALTTFTGVQDVKAILNISPAVPSATFRTTIYAVAEDADPESVRTTVAEVAERVRGFAPGYTVSACTSRSDLVTVTVEVAAESDVLPRYAGNLDIINSAAISVVEQYDAPAPRMISAETRG